MKATEKRVNILTKAAYLGLLLSIVVHLLFILFPNIDLELFTFLLLMGFFGVGGPAFLMILDYLKSQNNAKPSAFEALMETVPNCMRTFNKVIGAYGLLVSVITLIYDINGLIVFSVGGMFFYTMAISFCHILKNKVLDLDA